MNISIVNAPGKNLKPEAICYFHGLDAKYHRSPLISAVPVDQAGALVISADASSLVFSFRLDKFKFYEGAEARRVAGGTSIRELVKAGSQRLLWMLNGEISPEAFRDFVVGALLADYRFEAYKSNGKRNQVNLTIIAGDNVAMFRRELKRLEIINTGVCTARDLANMPGCDLVPTDLADYAKILAKDVGLSYKQLSAAQLERGGYTGLITVGRGCVNPPVLFTLTHSPKQVSKGARPLCLVGKGLTFDSGGINLKPFADMWHMKADMGGAAAVIGAMHAIALLDLRVPVVGVVAAAQNMPDGNAYMPGDILRYRNGRTVEIQNTDAEGRLVLADALLYAQETLKQRRIVDFATLTGACVRALGEQYIGLFTRSAELHKDVERAARISGEAVWELPLNLEYRKLLESSVADIRNIGGPLAGAQTAAWFLHEFVEDQTEYVHLDIAGTFVAHKADKYWGQPGMTGSGTRLAVELAELSV